mmetsp:Transcript_94152/g.280991  ORF Transcript_94152/g.280991 Transcript_94152/m.280991 type:complete len:323 (-) Transcript_94152:6-974(-)
MRPVVDHSPLTLPPVYAEPRVVAVVVAPCHSHCETLPANGDAVLPAPSRHCPASTPVPVVVIVRKVEDLIGRGLLHRAAAVAHRRQKRAPEEVVVQRLVLVPQLDAPHAQGVARAWIRAGDGPAAVEVLRQPPHGEHHLGLRLAAGGRHGFGAVALQGLLAGDDGLHHLLHVDRELGGTAAERRASKQPLEKRWQLRDGGPGPLPDLHRLLVLLRGVGSPRRQSLLKDDAGLGREVPPLVQRDAPGLPADLLAVRRQGGGGGLVLFLHFGKQRNDTLSTDKRRRGGWAPRNAARFDSRGAGAGTTAHQCGRSRPTLSHRLCP